MLAFEGFAVPGRIGPVSGHFQPGRLTCLLGPNGSGKSSLLAGAAGLLSGQGKISLDERRLERYGLAELARRRALLGQQQTMPLGLRGFELLALGAEPIGGVSEAVCQAIADLTEPLGLASLLERTVSSLSGGEQQRLMIAKTLVQVSPSVNSQARLLLLDEPLASLDWQHQLSVLRVLQQLSRQGLAVVVSIHDINLACHYGDELWCLQQGQLVARGGPEVITCCLIDQVFGVRTRQLEQDGSQVFVPLD
ncbi:ABC transporter ATP-binding protein [Zobellella maritima]|uniref:ABC transporter ATP-binding protein n=1 Tax=Zobellella maritima TaxID=2059725 RepID=UPI000E306277|nr:ABC transporter ATP-binding protein [Zobellella maritima]